MKKVRIGLISFFIVLNIAFFIGISIKRPRVVILHSYSADYQWVKNLNKGINSVLGKKNYLRVTTMYLNGKVHQQSSYLNKESKSFVEIIKKISPDVLIAADDIAQAYVAKHFINDKSIAIVFVGVNANAATYGYENASNVTGLLERLPFVGIKDVFSSMFPKYHRIAHISDASITSGYIDARVKAYQWAPLTLLGSYATNNYTEWKKTVLSLKGKVDVILVSHYETLYEAGQPVSDKTVLDWTLAHSPVPLIGLYGFFSQQGGPFVIASPGVLQGEIVAKMAMDIIDNGTKPSSIPIQETAIFDVFFHMKAFHEMFKGIEIPLSYRSLAAASNQIYP